MSYANIKYQGQAFNIRHLTVVVWLFVLLCCFLSRAALCAPDTMKEMLTLPTPAAMPTGTTEQVAENLARQLVFERQDDLPCLLAALRAAGIGVAGPGKTILLQPLTPSQGIAFDSWEVRGIALGEVHGMQIPLSNISAVLSETMPALKNAPLDTMLLDSIRFDTKSKNPQLRLWANLIVQLGLQSPEPYDLRQKVDSASIRLDAVQSALILRRLMGDVYALGLTQKKASTQTFGTAHLAGFHPPVHFMLAEKENCTLTESDMLILDNAATGLTTGFETVIEFIKEHGFPGVGPILQITGIANVLLSYLKFVMIYGNLNVAISMDGAGPPLVRTKSSRGPGDTRQLTAVLREDLKNWQWVNCARMAANQIGLDFDLPNDGPVKGAEVSWQLVKGQGATVNYPSPKAGYLRLIGNYLNLPTDETGTVKVRVQGMPQKKEISPDTPPEMKEAAVRVLVKVQPDTIMKDLTDAAAIAVPLRPKESGYGNPLSLLSLPPNLLYRTMWFSKTYTFAVKDWVHDVHFYLKAHIVQQPNDNGNMSGVIEGDLLPGLMPSASKGNSNVTTVYENVLQSEFTGMGHIPSLGSIGHISQPIDVKLEVNKNGYKLHLQLVGKPTSTPVKDDYVQSQQGFAFAIFTRDPQTTGPEDLSEGGIVRLYPWPHPRNSVVWDLTVSENE